MRTQSILALTSMGYTLVTLTNLSVRADTNAPVKLTRPDWASGPLQLRSLDARTPPLSVLPPEIPVDESSDRPASRTALSAAGQAEVLAILPHATFEPDLHATGSLQGELAAHLQPPPQESSGFFERVVVDAFVPTEVHVGETTVSCSVVTAIKRKNPLCLLNPIVLNISW